MPSTNSLLKQQFLSLFRHPAKRLPGWFIILLLGALSLITPFSVDMYLPAFARIATEFKTTTAGISLSLSTYFVGFALGQILYGPLLDRFGRKPPIFLGLNLYLIASLGCAHPPNLRAFILLRFFEAIGGCVAQVAAVTMVRDFFPPSQSARVFSLIFLVIGVSPLLAPSIGSLIMVWFGWRTIFLTLTVFSIVTLLIVSLLLPEMHQPDPSISLKPQLMLQEFWRILIDPQFRTYALAGAFSFAGLFAYVAGSPIIFMDGFGVSAKTFGAIFAVLTMGFIGGSQVNVFLLRRFTSQQIFSAALTFQVVIGALFMTGARLGWYGMGASLVLFFLFLSCIGLTYPNAAAIALAPFSRNAGSASALLGFIQTGTGAVMSMGIGVFGANSVILLLGGSAALALALFKFGKRSVRELMVASDNVPVMH